MATSTIPAFKRALLARLAADATLTGIQVCRQDPFPDQPADDRVVIGRARAEQTSAAIGNRSREERYTVDVVVQVIRSDQSSAADAEDRAYAIVALLEASLRAWMELPTPMSGVVRWGLVTSMEDWAGIGPGSREARVTTGVWVTARI